MKDHKLLKWVKRHSTPEKTTTVEGCGEDGLTTDKRAVITSVPCAAKINPRVFSDVAVAT